MYHYMTSSCKKNYSRLVLADYYSTTIKAMLKASVFQIGDADISSFIAPGERAEVLLLV